MPLIVACLCDDLGLFKLLELIDSSLTDLDRRDVVVGDKVLPEGLDLLFLDSPDTKCYNWLFTFAIR